MKKINIRIEKTTEPVALEKIKSLLEENFSDGNKSIGYMIENPWCFKAGLLNSVKELEDNCYKDCQRLCVFDKDTEINAESDDNGFVYSLISEKNGTDEVYVREHDIMLTNRNATKDFYEEEFNAVTAKEYFSKEKPYAVGPEGNSVTMSSGMLVKTAQRLCAPVHVNKKGLRDLDGGNE